MWHWDDTKHYSGTMNKTESLGGGFCMKKEDMRKRVDYFVL